MAMAGSAVGRPPAPQAPEGAHPQEPRNAAGPSTPADHPPYPGGFAGFPARRGRERPTRLNRRGRPSSCPPDLNSPAIWLGERGVGGACGTTGGLEEL
jgi:hypothetical protein